MSDDDEQQGLEDDLLACLDEEDEVVVKVEDEVVALHRDAGTYLPSPPEQVLALIGEDLTMRIVMVRVLRSSNSLHGFHR